MIPQTALEAWQIQLNLCACEKYKQLHRKTLIQSQWVRLKPWLHNQSYQVTKNNQTAATGDLTSTNTRLSVMLNSDTSMTSVECTLLDYFSQEIHYNVTNQYGKFIIG